MKLPPLLAVSFASVVAAALPAQPIVRDGAFEKLPLVSTSDPKTWAPAESTAEPSTARVQTAPVSWHWHVDVDHRAGEPKYPIGWPRIGHAIPAGALRDWSAWDFLHMWVYVETTREALPREPAGLGLHTPDRASAYSRALGELQKDRWVELNLPIAAIPRAGDVRNIQFHLAEANYRHGDRVDVYLNDLALTRYAEPTLFDLAPENTVVLADAARLPVRFQLLGVKPGGRVDVRCELRRGDTVAAQASVPVVRGPQRAVLSLAGARLAPGSYELRASIAGRPQAAVATVRVVESPWSQ